MAYITVDELREHLEATALPDAALQRLIDDVEYQIDDKYGPVGVDVVELPSVDFSSIPTCVVRRKIATVTSIVEWLDSNGSTTRTLDPSDYRVRGYVLERLAGGPNPAYGWSGYGVVVTYRPRDDSPRRAMAIVDVAKFEVAHSGFGSRTIGDYSESKSLGGKSGASSLDGDRASLLRARLAPRAGVIFQ